LLFCRKLKGFKIIRHIQVMNIETRFRIESNKCWNFVRGSLNVS